MWLLLKANVRLDATDVNLGQLWLVLTAGGKSVKGFLEKSHGPSCVELRLLRLPCLKTVETQYK